MLGAVYILEKKGKGFYKVVEKVVNEFVNDSDLEALTTSLANDVFAKMEQLVRLNQQTISL